MAVATVETVTEGASIKPDASNESGPPVTPQEKKGLIEQADVSGAAKKMSQPG